MADEIIDPRILELRKLLKENNLVIGTNKSIKGLKLGKVSRVFLASNVNPRTQSSVLHYADIGRVEVNHLPVLNDELGAYCKKPFAISVISVWK
ncbi:ribosomal L7Ae/L30e/S12e/Gadd45 family protein [Candidatus Woesearchaeota archaeon]|nr:ribosomal L7Ae/L30e/S12e/Gadd45 family protein [Candidatus Woesearchaeota archaeon]